MPNDTRSTNSESERLAQEARQAVKQQAGAMWQDAKETARSRLGDGKQTVAGGIGDIAEALRASGRELEGHEQPTVARFAYGAADSLEQLSSTLERRDLEALMHDAESLARRQPALFFGAAAAAGFLAVRFMKSSQSPNPNT